ncbi:hypothetical protein WN943_009965 [Citrus x changshan-huyou]
MGHIERHGPDPQHLADPPDDHNLPAVPMVDDDGEGMAVGEDSMVQEMPLALIEDATGQQ